MTRAHPLPLLALALATLLLAGVASAQAVRYTVEVLTANGQPAALDSFRGGDLLDLRIGIHNASDRALEPGSVWIVVPPAEGVRTQIATAGLEYTDPERYLDASGREAAGFEANLTAYYPALVEPLPPGANHFVRIRLSVVSSANGLAGLFDALRLNNRFDRTIGTRVDELPAPVAAAARTGRASGAANQAAPVDPIEQHVATMFGHVDAIPVSCADAGVTLDRTICGTVRSGFQQFHERWDRYFDSASDTPVTAAALGRWSNDGAGEIRAFEIGREWFHVAYFDRGITGGIVVVYLPR